MRFANKAEIISLLMRKCGQAKRWAVACALVIALAFSVLPAAAAKTGSVTGYPIPRWVTIDSDTANMRVGPGTDYPVRYVYHRKGLPVEVTAEFGHWRRIRDLDGDEGWVHKALIDGVRSVVIKDGAGESGLRPMFAEATPGAPVVALLEPGVLAKLDSCSGAWCQISADGRTGFVPRDILWGVYPDETVP